jgi:hypothetical protein
MAKNNITQWSATSASNTDVGGIQIEGENVVANFDNALREIMKQIADLNTGASFIHDTYKIADSDDETKLAKFNAGSITAGQTRTFTFPDKDGTFAVSSDVLSLAGGTMTGDLDMGGNAINNYNAANWNWIINGDFSVNQRGAATKAQSVGDYGYDRWKGHASGLEQVVESLPAGEYTLTWSGGGNGTFGGTTAASPIKATVTAGDTSVIVPSTATNVSLVLGDHTSQDPFVARPMAQEVNLCLRYYYKISGWMLREYVSNVFRLSCPLPTVMRVSPTITHTLGPTTGLNANNTSANTTTLIWRFQYTGGGTGVIDIAESTTELDADF